MAASYNEAKTGFTRRLSGKGRSENEGAAERSTRRPSSSWPSPTMTRRRIGPRSMPRPASSSPSRAATVHGTIKVGPSATPRSLNMRSSGSGVEVCRCLTRGDSDNEGEMASKEGKRGRETEDWRQWGQARERAALGHWRSHGRSMCGSA